MRFHVNGAKAYFIACTLLVWTLTACAGGGLPTESLTPTYEVIAPPNNLGQGMAHTKLLDKNGQVIHEETYEAAPAAAARAHITAGMNLSPLDSLNMRAMAILLTRGPTGQAVSFRVGGKEFAIQVTQRGANGGAKQFAILLPGDTSVVVTSAANGAANQQIEIHAGDEILYTSTMEIGAAPPSHGSVISLLSEECSSLLTLGSLELTTGILSLVNSWQDGNNGIDLLLSVFWGMVLLHASLQEMTQAYATCTAEFQELLSNGADPCSLPGFRELGVLLYTCQN